MSSREVLTPPPSCPLEVAGFRKGVFLLASASLLFVAMLSCLKENEHGSTPLQYQSEGTAPFATHTHTHCARAETQTRNTFARSPEQTNKKHTHTHTHNFFPCMSLLVLVSPLASPSLPFFLFSPSALDSFFNTHTQHATHTTTPRFPLFFPMHLKTEVTQQTRSLGGRTQKTKKTKNKQTNTSTHTRVPGKKQTNKQHDARVANPPPPNPSHIPLFPSFFALRHPQQPPKEYLLAVSGHYLKTTHAPGYLFIFIFIFPFIFFYIFFGVVSFFFSWPPFFAPEKKPRTPSFSSSPFDPHPHQPIHRTTSTNKQNMEETQNAKQRTACTFLSPPTTQSPSPPTAGSGKKKQQQQRSSTTSIGKQTGR